MKRGSLTVMLVTQIHWTPPNASVSHSGCNCWSIKLPSDLDLHLVQTIKFISHGCMQMNRRPNGGNGKNIDRNLSVLFL